MTEHMTDERISDERLAEMLAIDLERASFDLSDEDDIIAALRELQARRAAEAWRPIETAPKGETILLNTPLEWVVARWYPPGGWRQAFSPSSGLITDADMWLPVPPLPEPPR